jgi:hypothetical protein
VFFTATQKPTWKFKSNVPAHSRPTKGLPTADLPPGIEPAVGDIAYYAPWGNLAIFYRGFAYSEGLYKLGRIDSGLEALRKNRSATVSIERVGDS